mmetsp:Transcript_8600/g.13185  ORF Transcript_8600/g.13185 Transcript_8600/m.13185 type:complete len:142 (+) Transcript_8600:587-1012(+)
MALRRKKESHQVAMPLLLGWSPHRQRTLLPHWNLKRQQLKKLQTGQKLLRNQLRVTEMPLLLKLLKKLGNLPQLQLRMQVATRRVMPTNEGVQPRVQEEGFYLKVSDEDFDYNAKLGDLWVYIEQLYFPGVSLPILWYGDK